MGRGMDDTIGNLRMLEALGRYPPDWPALSSVPDTKYCFECWQPIRTKEYRGTDICAECRKINAAWERKIRQRLTGDPELKRQLGMPDAAIDVRKGALAIDDDGQELFTFDYFGMLVRRQRGFCIYYPETELVKYGPFCIQVWQVYIRRSNSDSDDIYGEYLWHPVEDVDAFRFKNMSSIPSADQIKAAHEILDGLALLLKEKPQRGRRKGSGTFRNAAEFHATIEKIVETLLRTPNRRGRRITQAEIAKHLDKDERTLREWFDKYKTYRGRGWAYYESYRLPDG